MDVSWLDSNIVAQAGLPENPLGYGILGLIVVLWMTGWLYSRGSYLKEVERGDKLEAALEKQREATVLALEGMRELRELGELLRHVLEGLPSVDAPPKPRSKPSSRIQRQVR